MRRRPPAAGPGARLGSNPLILVATALLAVGLPGTVVQLVVACLIHSNLLLLAGTFSRAMQAELLSGPLV